MKMCNILLVFALAVSLLHSLPAHADQLVLTPVQDTTLIEENPNYANGAGDNLFIGSIVGGASRRALMKFDLSGIPPGSQITSATLRFLINRSARNSGIDDIAAVHRVTAAWGEGTSSAPGGSGDQASSQDATWLYRFYGGGSVTRQSWSAPGGDFVAIASSSVTIGSIGYYQIPTTPQLIADLQLWLANPGNNFGWVMLGPEDAQQDARRITSRESSSIPDRPTLTVTFTPPSSTDADVPLPLWSLVLLGMGLMALSRRAR